MSKQDAAEDFDEEDKTHEVKNDKKLKHQDHHTSHDKRVHNTGSRDSHNNHADGHDGHKMKHEGYDKHSGTGVGKEVKKGGHGKGGWGSEDYDKVGKHHTTEEATELLQEDAEPAEQEPVEQATEQEAGEIKEEQKNEHHDFKMKEEDFPSLS